MILKEMNADSSLSPSPVNGLVSVSKDEIRSLKKYLAYQDGAPTGEEQDPKKVSQTSQQILG